MCLLKASYIALEMPVKDYKKIKDTLPTPSHKQILTSFVENKKVIIVFEIKHHLKTAYQYQWLSSIKLIWQKNIFVSFEYINEFYINKNTICSGVIYSLNELSRVFKQEFIKYPKPMYPVDKKDLYKKLVWYAIRLKEKKLLTLDAVYAMALNFNNSLDINRRYTQKDLYKKAFIAYKFVLSNYETKSKGDIKRIQRENGLKRGKDIHKEKLLRMERIKRLIPHHIKKNGKPNLSQIAKEMKVTRKTISLLYNQIIKASVFLLWIKSSLYLMTISTLHYL